MNYLFRFLIITNFLFISVNGFCGPEKCYPKNKIDSLKYFQYRCRVSQLEAIISKNQFVNYGNEISKKNYNWQLRSGVYIFWVVIGIVFTGIIFSGIQFYIGLKAVNHKIKNPVIQNLPVPDPTQSSGTSTIKLSKDGVEVTSPVLGVIILAFSLGFFYLYLHYVYPIYQNDLGAGKSSVKSYKIPS